nr:uncharacterized protein LOC124817390 [Hydra vulgaris]
MKFTRIYFFTFVTHLSALQFENIGCGAYPAVVVTDKNYKFIPLAVNITRCFGKDHGTHLLMKCEPTLTQNVSILTISFEGVPSTSTVLNHVSCEEKCILNASSCNKYQLFSADDCQCLCKHNTLSVSCLYPLIWDKTLCNCVCRYDKNSYKCEEKKEFSVSYCGCVCKPKYYKACMEQTGKIFNTVTCACEDLPLGEKLESPSCKNIVMKVVVTVVVFVEAVILFLILYFYTRYTNAKKKVEIND